MSKDPKFFYVRYIFDSSGKVNDAFVCGNCYGNLIASLNSPCNHATDDITGQVPSHLKECEHCGIAVTEEQK